MLHDIATAQGENAGRTDTHAIAGKNGNIATILRQDALIHGLIAAQVDPHQQ